MIRYTITMEGFINQLQALIDEEASISSQWQYIVELGNESNAGSYNWTYKTDRSAPCGWWKTNHWGYRYITEISLGADHPLIRYKQIQIKWRDILMRLSEVQDVPGLDSIISKLVMPGNRFHTDVDQNIYCTRYNNFFLITHPINNIDRYMQDLKSLMVKKIDTSSQMLGLQNENRLLKMRMDDVLAENDALKRQIKILEEYISNEISR